MRCELANDTWYFHPYFIVNIQLNALPSHCTHSLPHPSNPCWHQSSCSNQSCHWALPAINGPSIDGALSPGSLQGCAIKWMIAWLCLTVWRVHGSLHSAQQHGKQKVPKAANRAARSRSVVKMRDLWAEYVLPGKICASRRIRDHNYARNYARA